MSSMSDKCAHCGGEMPSDARTYRKYCCTECRLLDYRADYRASHTAINAARRAQRLESRVASLPPPPPCAECGTLLPVTRHRAAKFCCVTCCDTFHNKKRHAREKEARARLAALPSSA